MLYFIYFYSDVSGFVSADDEAEIARDQKFHRWISFYIY